MDIHCSTEDVCNAFRIAMKRIHGKFLLCPNVEHIVKDVDRMGYYPFIVPTNWTVNEKFVPNWKDRLIVPEEIIRDPNEEEKILIDWALECCQKFGMVYKNVVIKVFDDDDKASGYALMKGDGIWLASKIFNDRRSFLMIILEEIGHIDSFACDYTREFTEYFIGKIADHYIHHS
jgi:hypothetical protein